MKSNQLLIVKHQSQNIDNITPFLGGRGWGWVGVLFRSLRDFLKAFFGTEVFIIRAFTKQLRQQWHQQ